MNTRNSQEDSLKEKSKRYSYLKYSFAILETFYLILLLFVFLVSGLSRALAESIRLVNDNNYLVIAVYLLVIYSVYYILDFPLNFYRSFKLEHKFSLSSQSLGDWFLDQVKSGVLGYLLGLILLFTFYYLLQSYPSSWWLRASLFWIFFSLILAKLLPILIIPLFFKYKKLSDEALRQRIIRLAEKMKVKILDCFEIDFSKKTTKANAAFVGIGRTKRVILADTLRDKYTPDEIEVILAHEFAHYRLRHLLKLILVNAVSTILFFYLIFKASRYLLEIFGLSTLSDIATLPLILVCFTLYGIIIQPFENYLSRRLERNADILALEVTGLKEAFISMMDKLASQNLADRDPHPLIKIFFFDHPSIEERIRIAKSLEN